MDESRDSYLPIPVVVYLYILYVVYIHKFFGWRVLLFFSVSYVLYNTRFSISLGGLLIDSTCTDQ